MTAVQSSPPPPFLDRIDHPIAGSSKIYAPTPVRPLPIATIHSPSSPAKRDVISRGSTPSRPPSRTERKFKCLYAGCDKAYFKPARLREHELSHTGERPHVCSICGQSYLRATHLVAHSRTHKSNEERTFICGVPNCDKRFWTATHLKRHEEWHDQAISYKCELCDQSFHKTHQLREHNALAHLPAGTKPFICQSPDCGASFAVKAHLKAHMKTHDASRYTCSHPSHDKFPIFPTWTALQVHTRDAHPACCPHAECDGRTFKNKQSLRTHLKVHAQQQADRASQAATPVLNEDDLMSLEKDRPKRPRASISHLDEEEYEDAPSPKKSKLGRIIGGDAGRDFPCPDESCGKRFKSKYAAKTHHTATHLGAKSFVCPREGCGAGFAHNGTLKKHLAKHPSAPTVGAGTSGDPTGPDDLGGDEGEQRERGAEGGSTRMEIEEKPYEVWKLWEEQRRRFACPIEKTGIVGGCVARFWRVYDVRRHLAVEHELELGDEEVRRLLLSGEGELILEEEEAEKPPHAKAADLQA